MSIRVSRYLPILAVPLVVACGGGGGSDTGGSTVSATPVTTPGTLVYNPPIRVVSLTAAQLQGSLDATAAGTQLNILASGSTTPGGSTPNPLKCGVDIYKLEFDTVGGAQETTQSSGALMVPTGTGCSGPKPIVLYAHGTAIAKNFDLTQLADTTNPANGESALIAAIYASNGLIVVAPNYAGYDISTLGYHPYLNASQQSHEMQDSLTAARTALAGLPSTGDAGVLFVAGYSQGGHVAMATLRDLEAAGKTVTAAATMSGPYAMEAFGDIIFGGQVDIGATLFIPLLSTSYQKAYGNLYQAPSDLYSATYASGIETLLPTLLTQTQLFTQGLLPETALLDSTPTDAALAPPTPTTFGFGNPYLINDSARLSYLADAAANPDGALLPTPTGQLAAAPGNTVRQALKKNDLRAPPAGSALPVWLPKAPLLMCLGGNDPVVFSTNTLIMSGYFNGVQAALAPSATLLRHVLNVDLNPVGSTATQVGPAASTDPVFGLLQEAFTSNYNAGAGTTAATQQAALAGYHSAVGPFCIAASASFFDQPR